MILWNPPADAGDAVAGLIPGSERCPGEGNSNPLQDSCLENSMDRRAREAISPWDYKELDMTKHVCKKNVII